MDTHSILKNLRSFVIQNYLMGRDTGLTDDDSFLDSGIIDSTGVLELVAYLEESYGFKVDNEELTTDNLDSISKVSAYVHSKLARAEREAASAIQGAGTTITIGVSRNVTSTDRTF